jgi:hypothetical protein
MEVCNIETVASRAAMQTMPMHLQRPQLSMLATLHLTPVKSRSTRYALLALHH